MVLSLFKRKQEKEFKKIIGGKAYYHLQVKKVIRETDDAITIIFDNPNDEITYKPGQYLTLILEIKGEKFRRSYSLSSSPDYDKEIAVTVKKIGGGKVSHYLNHNLKNGDWIEIMEPLGNFTTDFNPEISRTLLMFAGGSGITPLISIIKSALILEPNSKVILVYQNRHESSMIFNELIQKLILEFNDRFEVHHYLSQPSSEWGGKKGRLTESEIKKILEDKRFSLEGLHVFSCGPEGMMSNVHSSLDKIKFPLNRRYKESFTTSSSSLDLKKDKTLNTENINSTVTIILDNEEHVIQVPKNDYILETALDADLNLPFSCQSGLCTSCRGRLISGEVNMEDPDGITEEEIADGYILTCISQPVSEKIKIEIG